MIKIVICLALVLIAQSQTCPSACPGGTTIRFVSEALTTLVTGPKIFIQAPAVLNTFIHGAWTASIPGSSWISDEPVLSVSLSPPETFRYYTRFINLPCSPTSATIVWAADNSLKTYVNGQYVPACSNQNENNHGAAKSCDIKSLLTVGNNVISWVVRNWAQGGGSPYSNPTRLRYRIDAVV